VIHLAIARARRRNPAMESTIFDFIQSVLLPPAPLDDRAAQPEPKPKPGQLAGAVDEERHLALAHQNYRSGKYREALEHGNVVYEKNPRRTDNLLLLGAIYYQIRNYDMCIAKNEEALAIDPHFAECYGNMANAWKEKGDIDLAIRYYLTAIQLRPNFCDAWSNLASAYTRKGRLNEAAQCCRQALAINPRLVCTCAHVKLLVCLIVCELMPFCADLG
jgi:protein O-GlcNAc transferase